MTKLTSALAATVLVAASQSAYAEGSSRFSGELELEFSGVSTFDAPTAADEINDIYGAVTVALEYDLGGGFTVFSEFILEPVIDPVDDRVFEDNGVYVSEFGVSFSNDNFTVGGGKISPAFALAWDAAPGFFGADIAEDYELGEAIGGFVEVPFNLGGGKHTVSASVFYTDTTELSNSFGEERGRITLAAGGAGNTEKFDNFALQFAGNFGDTEYNLSLRQLSAGVGDVSDETGASLGLQRSFEISGGDLTLLGEIARFNGFGGTVDDVTYGTLGAAYAMDKWVFAASYTGRNGVGGANDNLASLGVDYDFGNDLVGSFGLSELEEAGATSRAVAVSIVKVFSFGG